MSLLYRFSAAFLLVSALAVPAFGEEYLLGRQDKISVNAHGYPNVSGEYLVGPAGTISLPLVGSIQAENQSLDATAGAIAQALRRTMGEGEDIDVAVQISEFRPFFIVGDVQRPGRYAYEPGMTVLKAMSTAGGGYRHSDSDSFRFGRDAVNAEGAIRTLRISAEQLRLRIARLQAEIDGEARFDPPRDAIDPSSDYARSFIQQEQMIFAAKRKLLLGQSAALEKLSQVYRGEVQSLRERVRLKKISVEAAQKRFDRDSELARRGGTASSLVLERERLLADTRAEEEELLTLVLRAEQGITQSEQSLRSLLDGRQRDNVQELHEAEVELYECMEKIKTAQHLLYEARVLAPAAYQALSLSNQATLAYVIARTENNRTTEIKVDEHTLILPGDVIKVAGVVSADLAGKFTATHPDPSN